MGTEATSALGFGTPDPKPVQVGAAYSISTGLGLTMSEPIFPEVSACLVRGFHPAEMLESLEYKCMSSVMVTAWHVGEDGGCRGVMVVLLLGLAQCRGTAEQTVGQWAQVVVNRVEMWDHQV